MKDIIQMYKKYKRKRMLNSMKNFYSLDETSFLMDGFNLRIDFPIKNHNFLEIGKDCIIEGSFIFEAPLGIVKIGNNCFVGGSTFISNSEIIIEDNVTIAWGSTFYTHNSHSLDYKERQNDMALQLENLRNKKKMTESKNWQTVVSKPIRICKNAWIGMNCIILKGVTIGEGAIVGAGSVVAKDVEPWTVVAGNPAKIVKRLK